jgi:hypothetical protein
MLRLVSTSADIVPRIPAISRRAMAPQSATAEAANESEHIVHDLAQIMVRTLPEAGMDRMTSERVEEVPSVPALTAHI